MQSPIQSDASINESLGLGLAVEYTSDSPLFLQQVCRGQGAVMGTLGRMPCGVLCVASCTLNLTSSSSSSSPSYPSVSCALDHCLRRILRGLFTLLLEHGTCAGGAYTYLSKYPVCAWAWVCAYMHMYIYQWRIHLYTHFACVRMQCDRLCVSNAITPTPIHPPITYLRTRIHRFMSKPFQLCNLPNTTYKQHSLASNTAGVYSPTQFRPSGI
jgi:hypothetical protein